MRSPLSPGPRSAIARGAGWWAVPLVALALLAAIGCAINPVSGRRELSLVSADQEAQMGRAAMPAVITQYGRYDDPALAAYVDSVGHRLAAVSQLPNLDWHFTLLDDPAVNAFAMPGGYIYITRGILAHLGSEAQLAGVLGHEIGHVTARHAARQMTQRGLAGLGLGLAEMFSTTLRQLDPVTQQALGLMMLKYSRDDETQADQLGVDYASKAGWDPREIPKTYAMLGRISAKAGDRLPSFLATHPDPGARQERTAQLAVAAVAGRSGLIVREREYLRRMDGVVFGNDPRKGYFDGDVLVHPRAGFEARFPSGWKRQTTQQSVVAAKPDQSAGMELALSPTTTDQAPDARIATLQATGKITSANGRAETIGGYAGWVGTIVVPGDRAPVRMVLGLVRLSALGTLQVTGQSAAGGDADEAAIVATIRSIHPITDAARGTPPVPRVSVASATRAGTFTSAVKDLGTQAIGLDDLAILNNREVDESVLAGELIKGVKRAAR